MWRGVSYSEEQNKNFCDVTRQPRRAIHSGMRPLVVLFSDPHTTFSRPLYSSVAYRGPVLIAAESCGVCETTEATHLTTTLTMCCVQHAAVGIFLGENVFAVARNFSDCFLSSTKITILSIDDSLFLPLTNSVLCAPYFVGLCRANRDRSGQEYRAVTCRNVLPARIFYLLLFRRQPL